MNQHRPKGNGSVVFGPFELFPLERKLLRDGNPVQLGSRALDLLVILIERSGDLVSKEELIGRVWPETHVEEVALRVHLTALRKILTDGRPEARDLINVPGRGYQFVTPVVAKQERETWVHPPMPAKQVVSLRSSLPFPITRVIGRDDDIDLLVGRVQMGRCVTITGPGGIGKTTVSAVLASRIESSYPDGVYFIDLAPLSNLRHVVDAFASAMDVQSSGDLTVETLADAVGSKQALLLVDNCEQVSFEVGQVVGTLMRKNRKLAILATSREPLYLPGEWIYRLPTLGTPENNRVLTANEAMSYPAIALFVARAAASAEHFELDESNVAIVAGICTKLDGLALAIEMAATRLDKFGIADIAAMLEYRFSILKQRGPAQTGRHASLSATMDWSYDILGVTEQALLQNISFFAGKFSVEDATAVSDLGKTGPGEVIEALANLVDKSFVMIDLNGPVAFYRLYETIREYGRQKASACLSADNLKRVHARYVVSVMAKAEEESARIDAGRWVSLYGRYLDEVRAALYWLFKEWDDVVGGITLTASATVMWTHLSLLNEMEQGLEQALLKLDETDQICPSEQLKLFSAQSYVLVSLYGPTTKSTGACLRSLSIAKELGDYSSQAKAILALWNGCFANGEVLQSLSLAEEFMAVAEKLSRADVLVGHRMLGSSNFYLGDANKARRHMEIMVGGYGAVPHNTHMARFGFGQLASARGLLGYYLAFQGYYDKAINATRESACEAISTGHAMTICGVLSTTSIANAIYTGYLADARRYVDVLLETARRSGLQRWESVGIGYDGILSALSGRHDEALSKLTEAASAAGDRTNTRYMFIFSEHAVAMGRAGHVSAGLSAVDEIISKSEVAGLRWYLPELMRSKARLYQMDGASAQQIEEIYQRSLTLAEEIGAVNWRLRSLRDYADFLGSIDRPDEGFAALRQALESIPEGRNCPEIVEISNRLSKLKSAPH